MKRKPWTSADDDYLRQQYAVMPTSELAAIMGRTRYSLRGRATKLGIKTGYFWADAEIQAFTRLYPDTESKDLAQRFGRNVLAVYNLAERLGLKKSPAYLKRIQERTNRNLEEHGKAYRIQPGNTPWNKGLAGWCAEGCTATQFKPGNRPHGWKPLGSERISKDGYVERKVTDLQGVKNYRAVHLILWEAANGPLPAGHAVAFKDGNKRNLTLDNLELISRADLMRRNTRHRLPEELKEVIQLRAVLTRIINQKQRGNREEQADASA